MAVRADRQADDGAPRVLLHASLSVADIDHAQRFFTEALGFALDFRADALTDEVARLTGRPGLTVRIVQLSRPSDGCRLELIEFRDAGRVPSAGDGPVPLAHVAFAVADLDAEITRLSAAGAAAMGAVVAFPEGRCVYLRTPGGAIIELEELADPPACTG
jgi:catechol 2,3-dioxygenase-like lactoylglutathione lyase family enzyme